jgi:CRISPR-associated protein Cmr5
MPEAKPTRDQERAQAAYTRAKAAAEMPYAESYKQECRKLPALIHHCGLCQALAFYQAKSTGADSKAQILADLAAVAKLPGLMTLARTAGVQEYQHMTSEAMACGEWLKRYAEALVKDKD